jgi:hypothetical protein
VERGTRNHIIHLAFSSSGILSVIDFGLDEVIQPIINPNEIIVIGRIFIYIGRNVTVEEIGLIHVRIEPMEIAISASNDIGLMI